MATKKAKPVEPTLANPSQPAPSLNEAVKPTDASLSPQPSPSDAPAANEANTSPSAPSTPETANDTANDGNAPETGVSGDQAPNGQIKDPLENFEGSFVDLLKAMLADTEDGDEREALLELIPLVESYPGSEDDFIRLAIDTMLQQVKAERAKLNDITPTFPSGGVFSESEDVLTKESDEDRKARIMANAEAELEELKAQSRERAEAAQAQREAAGVESQEDRRNK